MHMKSSHIHLETHKVLSAAHILLPMPPGMNLGVHVWSKIEIQTAC
jgi:hypothetical protein